MMHNAARIRKIDKIFQSNVGFKDIKFPVKIKDICKIEKKTPIISALVSLVMKRRKNIQSMYQKRLSKDMLICY